MVALTVMAACSDPTSPYRPGDAVGRIRVDFGDNPGNWSADALSIDSARVSADTLHTFVTYGGGCARHEFALVAWNGWLESHPVQVSVLLAHDAHDDPCDALVTAHLRHDLRPLRDAWHRSYGGSTGEIVMQLTVARILNGAPLTVRYVF
jgi:hypothetical protein